MSVYVTRVMLQSSIYGHSLPNFDVGVYTARFVCIPVEATRLSLDPLARVLLRPIRAYDNTR